MKNNFDLNRLIDNLPEGLDRALLRVLSFHVGRQNAIVKGDILRDLALHGYRVNERTFRAQVNQLRKDGYLICSAANDPVGYYLPGSAEEFEDFVHQEYLAKIADMQEVLSAMQKSARQQWQQPAQARLF